MFYTFKRSEGINFESDSFTVKNFYTHLPGHDCARCLVSHFADRAARARSELAEELKVLVSELYIALRNARKRVYRGRADCDAADGCRAWRNRELQPALELWRRHGVLIGAKNRLFSLKKFF
jgi:hypothetical protein